MRERPILFSAPMVRAILNSTKTQTRRVVKPQPAPNAPHDGGTVWVPEDGLHVPVGTVGHLTVREKQGLRCPYGQPGACAGCGAVVDSGHRIGGDRLYVKEAWAAPHAYDHLPPRLIPQDARIHYAATEDRGGLLWRPSIYMPRAASRITLEITGVRVERLQDISADDAKDEGISEFIGGWWCEHDDAEQIAGMTPQEGYRHLWERINGPGSWDANPWVWCVSFRRVDAS